jgi:hypothetical protein
MTWLLFDVVLSVGELLDLLDLLTPSFGVGQATTDSPIPRRSWWLPERGTKSDSSPS